jgi:hypothetical protein
MRAALRSEWEQDPSDEERLRIIAEAMPLVERQLELVKARQKTLSKFAGELRKRLERMNQLRAEIEESEAQTRRHGAEPNGAPVS